MIDPYALPNGVLRNKLRLTDAELLATAEADLTRARLAQLSARPLPGTYDLDHLPTRCSAACVHATGCAAFPGAISSGGSPSCTAT